MATGLNLIADVDNIVVPMLAASRYTIEHETLMKQLTRNVRLEDRAGESYREPKWNTMTAQSLTRGVDMSNGQKLSDTLQTFTPSEVGIQVYLEKQLVRTRRDDMFTVAGKVMGLALSRKLDIDGLAMLDSFSLALGTAGTALTWEYISAAKTAIMGRSEPGPMPIYGAFHPHMLHPLAKDLAPTGTYPVPSGVSQEVIEQGFVAKSLAGVSIFQDGNITIDASDDAKGGVWSKEALILVMVGFPGIEKEYDSSLRAWELNQVWEYIWGEREDGWGREMLFDAVSPTS
jgi:hypothetical protein